MQDLAGKVAVVTFIYTGCADVATVEQAAHSRHDHRIGDHRVGLVDLVERNSLQLQPPRTGALSLLDHWGERRDWEDLAGYNNLGALVAESFPQNALALARAIYFGRIEQRHPQCTGTLHDVACGTRGVIFSVAPFA